MITVNRYISNIDDSVCFLCVTVCISVKTSMILAYYFCEFQSNYSTICFVREIRYANIIVISEMRHCGTENGKQAAYKV